MFGWRDVVDLAVHAPVVVPVDVLDGGHLQVVESAPAGSSYRRDVVRLVHEPQRLVARHRGRAEPDLVVGEQSEVARQRHGQVEPAGCHRVVAPRSYCSRSSLHRTRPDPLTVCLRSAASSPLTGPVSRHLALQPLQN